MNVVAVYQIIQIANSFLKYPERQKTKTVKKGTCSFQNLEEKTQRLLGRATAYNNNNNNISHNIGVLANLTTQDLSLQPTPQFQTPESYGCGIGIGV